MCRHCESEDSMELPQEMSRFVYGCFMISSQQRPDDSSVVSRVVEGSEVDTSSHYMTAVNSFKISSPLASSTFLDCRTPPVATSTAIDDRCRSRQLTPPLVSSTSKHRSRRPSLGTPPVASPTFIDNRCRSSLRTPQVTKFTSKDGRCRSSLRTPPVASSTFLDGRCRSSLRTPPVASSTLVHSSENSEDSGFGRSSSATQEHNSCKSRGQRRRSLGLFRTSTKSKLVSAGRDRKATRNPSPVAYEREDQGQSMQCSGTSDEVSMVKKQMKKNILKKFLSFSDSANRSELYTIACLW